MDCNYKHISKKVRNILQNFLENKRYDLFITHDGGLAIARKEFNDFIFGPINNNIDNLKLIDELYYINGHKDYHKMGDKVSRIMDNKKFQVLNSTLSKDYNNLNQLIKDITYDTSRNVQDICSLLQTLLSVYKYSEDTLENYRPFYNNKDNWELNKFMNDSETLKKPVKNTVSAGSIDELKNIYKQAQHDIQKAIDSINVLNEYSIINESTIAQKKSSTTTKNA